jgi:LysM repeat protein
MSRIKILIFLTLIFFLVPGSTSNAAPLTFPSGYDVISAVNALRARNGLPPYAVDPILMMSAQTQADYLASTQNFGSGHIGPGGTDADARAKALGFPFPVGLDINENWGMLQEDELVESLITGCWSDALHMHTMLHERGQLVGAGVGISGDTAYVILDVAAYWGDAGLTPQQTTSVYGENSATQYAVSQYIAPVKIAAPSLDGSITHTVMSGQSLWMIADKYKVDIKRLRELNNLGSSDTIYIGQKILIQLPQTPTPTKEITAVPSLTASLAATRAVVPKAAVRVTATVKNTETIPARNDSIWFMVFFALFGAGVILVILSQSARK